MMNLSQIAVNLGKRAKALSLVFGVLFFCLGILLSVFGVMQAAVNHAQQQQLRLGAMLSPVAADTRRLLVRLNEHESTACTAANLVQLRGIMHEYRYVRDIGIFNEHNRLYCTTDIGMLPRPIPSPNGGLALPADNHSWPSRRLKFNEGPQLWPSLEMLDAPRSLLTIVVKFGRFNVALDPSYRKELFAALHGSVWMKMTGNQLAPMLTQGSARIAKRLSPISKDTLRTGISYHLFPFRIDLARSVPNSGMVLFRSLSQHDVLNFAPRFLAGGIFLSMVFGILVTMTISPRLEKFQSPAFRIKYLCDKTHIRCFYQPIIRLTDGHVVGAEVLMRLFDDEKFLRPDEVFPHVIAQNLTWTVDRTVTAKAFEEIASLYHEMKGLTLAFNLFPDDARFDTAGKHLNMLCDCYKLKAEDITIELTEHQLTTVAAGEIPFFRNAGYKISVDDFGTGYSNLASLKSIKPDHIKIDRSFVYDMEQHSMKSSLIPEIIAIARSVHSEVVAEGIERQEHLTMLRELGAEFGQGYFIARPMPIDEFRNFVHANSGGNSGQATITSNANTTHQNIQNI